MSGARLQVESQKVVYGYFSAGDFSLFPIPR